MHTFECKDYNLLVYAENHSLFIAESWLRFLNSQVQCVIQINTWLNVRTQRTRWK